MIRTISLAKGVVTFYYTIATMTNVGYGDVVGTNTLERLVSIVNKIVGAIVFSIIMSNLQILAVLMI